MYYRYLISRYLNVLYKNRRRSLVDEGENTFAARPKMRTATWRSRESRDRERTEKRKLICLKQDMVQ